MLRVSSRRDAVRRLYRERHPVGSARELAFTVYAGILLFLSAVFPVARALVLVMADNAETLTSPDFPRWFGLASCVLLALLIVVGAVRGPAVTRAVFVWTIASNDLPRRTALLPPFLSAGAALSLLLGGAASLVGIALFTVGSGDAREVALFVAGAVLFGIAGATAWLLGQAIGSSRAWLTAAGILALGALTAWIPALLCFTPWGWFAQLSPSSSAAPLWLAALLLTATGCLVTAPVLIDRLRGTALVAQALRWESATVAGISGDLTLALALFRPLPRLGRHWHAVRPGRGWATYWWRGLLGALRTPGRMLGATTGLILGNTLVAVASTASPTASSAAAGVGGALGALLVFLSLGPLCDGLRHAAEAAAAPALYGYRNGTLVALMLVFPASVEALAALVPAAVLAFAEHPFALIASGSVGTVALLSRVLHSTKGPLPPLLLTPIPTPFGDLSGLAILAWQADALLIAGLTGTLVAVAVATGNVGLALGSTAVVAGTVAWLASRRYRRR